MARIDLIELLRHNHRVTDLERLYEESYNLRCKRYVCIKKQLSIGYWKSKLNMIEIKVMHGKCWSLLGTIVNSKLHLYPEEALFLMQCSILQVFNEEDNIPISMEEAYNFWLNDQLTLKHVQTFSYLARLGFIIRRHQQQQQEQQHERIKTTAVGIKRKRDEMDEHISILNINTNYHEAFLTRNNDTNNSSSQIEESMNDEMNDKNERHWFVGYDYDETNLINNKKRLNWSIDDCSWTKSRVLPHWLPKQFYEKVMDVDIPICQYLKTKTQFDLLYSTNDEPLMRLSDCKTHQTICERLSSFIHSDTLQAQAQSSLPRTPSLSSLTYDIYYPNKHFRKTLPGIPAYRLLVLDGNENDLSNQLDEIMFYCSNVSVLVALVHNGDVCFYCFSSFDASKTLRDPPKI
ncbi:unnamed protein product [Didymodactylos carnosus]|uniref:tRNA-splicing endonuclease subunit Sen54 N-terminal domain-containing protein n=1 Tax=Didymodactylos carnosus TaxID=1234261 RepID=A0A815CWN9_9BILA|nr:unnamed protein product [Didymodactylos carnosus]CAF1513291.1 unnamed protein product [Didymodactylos carnosus]CAF4093744.1 unnamed protein product [Didymodactylos carnosus]CAF4300882.1 unnamed protein product [Didymodactylos carnosus]